MTRTNSGFRPLRLVLALFLPISIALGFFIAGIGTAIWSPVSSWAAGLLCSGEIVDDSRYYTTPSGGSGVQRHLYCVTGSGKDAARDEVTFNGIALAGPLYAALIFAALLLFALPTARRKAEARAAMMASLGTFSTLRTSSGADLQDVLGEVVSAMREGRAGVTVRNVQLGGDAPDAAGRLAHVEQLRAAGLITPAEYDTKRREILDGL